MRDLLSDLESRWSGKPLLAPEEVEAAIPPPPPAAVGPDISALRRWVLAFDADRNQVGLLRSLVQAVHEHAARVAVFVVRGENLSGWAATGFTATGSVTDEQVKGLSYPLGDSTILREAATSNVYRVGGVQDHPDNAKFLRALGHLEPAQIAAFPLVNKGRVAAVLYCDSGDTDQIRSPDAVEILVCTATMSIELIPHRGAAPAAATAPTVTRPAAAQPARPAHAPAPAPARAPAPAPAPARAPAPAPAPARPAAGPDLASLPPDEQQLHKAAMRFARLLVSEIKLYNEAKVVEGRKNRNLYNVLKDDIDRSHQMYMGRVNPKIAASVDYFYEELVKTLAEGNASLLGDYRP